PASGTRRRVAVRGAGAARCSEGTAAPPPAGAGVCPAAGAVAAGTTVLMTGQAAATDAPLAFVTVNGRPVDALDASGNFFAQVAVAPGLNEFEVTAHDALGQSSSTTLRLRGTQLPDGAIDFDQLTDVSTSLGGVYQRTSFTEDTSVLHVDLAVSNQGQYPVDGPLLVGITHLSEPTVRVRDADGVTPDGIPYYDFT